MDARFEMLASIIFRVTEVHHSAAVASWQHHGHMLHRLCHSVLKHHDPQVISLGAKLELQLHILDILGHC